VSEPVDPSGPHEPVGPAWPAGPPQPGAPEPAPPGALVWTVKRRWIPRLGADTLWRRFYRRFRKTIRRTGDAADGGGCGDVIGEGIVAAIVLIIAVLVILFVIFPLLVAIVDLVVLLVLAVGGLVARVCFRRPWLIEARDGTGRVLRWQVVGWRASTQRVADLRQLLPTGVVPPDAVQFADAPIDEDA